MNKPDARDEFADLYALQLRELDTMEAMKGLRKYRESMQDSAASKRRYDLRMDTRVAVFLASVGLLLILIGVDGARLPVAGWKTVMLGGFSLMWSLGYALRVLSARRAVARRRLRPMPGAEPIDSQAEEP